jgi:flagellar biosynthesis protein FlhB
MKSLIKTLVIGTVCVSALKTAMDAVIDTVELHPEMSPWQSGALGLSAYTVAAMVTGYLAMTIYDTLFNTTNK